MSAEATVVQLASEPSLLERALASPPHWADDRIERWDERLFQRVQPFVTDKYWSDRHSINVFSVVGTQHPDYVGMTWLDFLRRGKRMRENLYLHATNPGYYLDTEAKTPPMYYVSMDGLKWFVAGDGNHRTCIARFDFHGRGLTMLHGVHLEDYRVDWTFWRIYQALKKTLGSRAELTVYNTRTARADTAGWMHETYAVRLIVQEGRKQFELDRWQAEEMLLRRSRRGLIWGFIK
jgi:uncharacterized protein Veg